MPADYVGALETRRDALGWRRRDLFKVVLLVVVSVAYFVAISPVIGVVGLVLAAVIAWPGTQRWVDRRAIDRLFRANPFLQAPLTVTFSDDGVSVHRESAGDAQTDYGWSAFVLWIESPELVVLCQSTARRGAFLPIAKRGAATPADLDLVRTALTAHVADARSTGLVDPR